MLTPHSSSAAPPPIPRCVSPLLHDIAIASGLMTSSDIELICKGKTEPIANLLGTENYTRGVAAYLAFHLLEASTTERRPSPPGSPLASIVLVPGGVEGSSQILPADPPRAVLYRSKHAFRAPLELGERMIRYAEDYTKSEQGYVLDHNPDDYVVVRIPYQYPPPTRTATSQSTTVMMPWYKGRAPGESDAAWDPPSTQEVRCVHIQTQASANAEADKKWTFLLDGIPVSDDYRYVPGDKLEVLFRTAGRDDYVHVRALASDGTITRGIMLKLRGSSVCTPWQPELRNATERDGVYGLVDLSDDGSCDGSISRSQIRAAVKQYFGENRVVDVDLPVQAASRLSEIDDITRELGQIGQLVEDRTDLGLQAGARVADFARWLRNESFGRPLLLKITCGQGNTIELSGMAINLPNLSNLRTGSSDNAMIRSDSVFMHGKDELRSGLGRLLASLSGRSNAWFEPGDRRFDFYSEHQLDYHLHSGENAERFRPSIRIAYVPNERQAQMVCDSIESYNRLDMIDQDQILEFIDIFSPEGRACDDKCIGDACETRLWFERCTGGRHNQQVFEGYGAAQKGPYPVLMFDAGFCSAKDPRSCVRSADAADFYRVHDGDATGALPFPMSRTGRYVAWIAWQAEQRATYRPLSAACFEVAEDRIYTSSWKLWVEVGDMILPRAFGEAHTGEIAIFQAMVGVGHSWGALRRTTWRAGLGYHQWRRTFAVLPSWDDIGTEQLDATGDDGQLRRPMTYVRRAIAMRTSVGFRFDTWGCWPHAWEKLARRAKDQTSQHELRQRSSRCARSSRRSVALELFGGAGLSVGFYDVERVEPWALGFTDIRDDPTSHDLDFEAFAGFRLLGHIAGGLGIYGFMSVGASDFDRVGYPQERSKISNNYNIFPLVGFGIDKGFKRVQPR